MHTNTFQLKTLYLDAFHDTQSICNKTLNQHGIHFFDYARMFDDGTCYLVSNNVDVINYLFETSAPVFTPVPSSSIREKFYYYIPEDGPYQKILHDARSYFNLANFIDLFEIHDSYVDVCCYGAPAHHNEMINYYFNHIDDLDNFVRDFKEQARDTLNRLNRNRIQLTAEMRLNFDSKAIANKSKKNVLSGRQSDCLALLIEGKTIKEIANDLQLSSRTVEHYIEYAKNKLGCGSRAELIIKYMKMSDSHKQD